MLINFIAFWTGKWQHPYFQIVWPLANVLLHFYYLSSDDKQHLNSTQENNPSVRFRHFLQLKLVPDDILRI
jgi:hypothetical protein